MPQLINPIFNPTSITQQLPTQYPYLLPFLAEFTTSFKIYLINQRIIQNPPYFPYLWMNLHVKLPTQAHPPPLHPPLFLPQPPLSLVGRQQSIHSPSTHTVHTHSNARQQHLIPHTIPIPPANPRNFNCTRAHLGGACDVCLSIYLSIYLSTVLSCRQQAVYDL